MKTRPFCNEIRALGEALITRYGADKTIDCGINGPYDDQETKVRDLSHLIVITALEGLLFDRVEMRQRVLVMAEELMALRGSDGMYRIRMKPGKDECNGVLGHAWVMEAFIYAYKATAQSSFLDEAVRVARMHGFHKGLGLWCRPLRGVDAGAIDYTLNHQLWYAATLMELNRFVDDPVFKEETEVFFVRLDKNFKTNRQGRITHSIYNRVGLPASVRQCIKKDKILLNELLGRPSFKYKEEGYHLFNLMAFARINRLDPSLSVFRTGCFQQALKYLGSPLFKEGLLSGKIVLDASLHNRIADPSEKEINIYGYPYNVPGFELMYVQEVFKTDRLAAEECLSEQFRLTFDEGTGFFGKRCHDKTTINYRIYEYYRYLEIIK